MISRVFNRYADYAPTLLRLMLAVVFIAHGYQKLFVMGISGVTAMFQSFGIPLPSLSAWIVALVEFFGGILLLIGFLTRYAATLIAIVMLVAILAVKLPIGLIGNGMCGAELDLGLLAGAIALMLLGPGKLSLEKAWLKREI